MYLKNLFKRNTCQHEWEEVNRYRVETYDNVWSSRILTSVKIVVEQKCKKCGEIKSTTIKL